MPISLSVRRKALSILISGAFALLSGCGGGGPTTKIIVTPSAPEPAMRDVYIIAGAMKEFFPTLSKEVSLSYSSGQRSEVTIIYELNGTKQSWTSPEFEPPEVSAIHVDIDSAAIPAAAAFQYRTTKRAAAGY